MTAGAHDVGVSFVRRHWEPEGILQPPQRGFARTTNELYYGNPAVDIVTIAGPYSAEAGGRTRRAAARCSCAVRASATSATSACARTILSRLARRAYRRPVTEQDLETLLAFYRAGQAEEGFDAGIQRGLRRILASPSFLFRIEREPANVAAGLGLSPQRHRSRVAALVLPVEQHSGRGTARRGDARNAQHAGRPGAAGDADARRPAIRRRSSTTS